MSDLVGGATAQQVLFFREDPRAGLPERAYPNEDVGIDLPTCTPVTIPPHSFGVAHTGIVLVPPPGHWLLLLGRSSTWVSRHLLVNPGVIDSGFRGALDALVFNPTDKPVYIKTGDKIVQALVMPNITVTMDLRQVASPEELPGSQRGHNCFGSSDKREEQEVAPSQPEMAFPGSRHGSYDY